MKLNGKELLICNCENTMTIDGKKIGESLGGKGDLSIASHLCRKQLEKFEIAASHGAPLMVGCTQEAPLFLDCVSEADTESLNIDFFNIRETAGWSEDGRKQKPSRNLSAKIAALISEAALDISPSRSVTMKSEGRLIILGNDEKAIEAAKNLSGRLEPTVLLEPNSTSVAPNVSQFPIFSGEIITASGYLGAFNLEIINFQVASPSSQTQLIFDGESDKAVLDCDLILDLREKKPLFGTSVHRDGYYNPDPKNRALVAETLLELYDMVGEFQKPQYINYDPSICAHASSQIIGCSKCLDSCPTNAISSQDDKVSFDPYICGGCGNCASSCPTGAARYSLPEDNGLMIRLRALVDTYKKAGGENPQILVYDGEWGNQMVAAMARFGRGLPANVIPFVVNESSMVGLDFMLTASALGFERVIILVPPTKKHELPLFETELSVADIVLQSLGYGDGRSLILCEEDPQTIENFLHVLEPFPGLPSGQFIPTGRKRSLLRQSLNELHSNAPNRVDKVKLPTGAPFGSIEVESDNCTLCLACVGACPVGALKDDPNKPSLSFMEDACVQCGLCKRTCPENVITLNPRLNFLPTAQAYQLIKEEDPFECIRCGKPFATKATIKKMTEKLTNHPMFSKAGALDRLSMCDDCRIIDMAENDANPLASGAVPIPKTTDDYLREREELRRTAELDLVKKGSPRDKKSE